MVGVAVLGGCGVAVGVGLFVNVMVAETVPATVAVAVAVPVIVPSGVAVLVAPGGGVAVLVEPGGAVAVFVDPGGTVSVAVPVAPGVLGAQTAVQASQQLGQVPMTAVPPLGARHLAALFLTAHLTLPLAVVRQQVTAPGRPQVDFFTHFLTADTHARGRVPSSFA
jgi:hypothetical protein